ncbi:MAG: MAPEG family protein [Pseudomonadota bacterium]
MSLPVTTILASCLALWLVILSIRVVRQRGAASVSLADGGDETLLRRIRAQANLTEYAPMMVILVGLAELQGGNFYIIGGFAALFLAARLSHGFALSFSKHNPAARIFGAAGSFTSLGFMALYDLFLVTT